MYKLKIEPHDKLLIVAPHPDDETIGCGGLMLAYGGQTDVLLITDGRTAHSDDITDEQCAIIRQAEFNNAITQAGINEGLYLKLPDGKAYRCGKALKTIDFTRYTKIFLPNRSEEHPDHRASYEYIKRRLFRKSCKAEIYVYEIWSPLSFATHYLDIGSIIHLKDQLIDCYESQLRIRDYHAMVRGLNAYRGICCHTEYAEAYELLSFKNKMKRWYFKLPIGWQERIIRITKR